MIKSKTGLGGVALLVTLLVGSTAVVAFPGGHHRGHHDPAKRIEKMLDAVDATDAQRQAIHDAVAAQQPDRKILRDRARELHRQAKALDPLAGDYLEQVEVIAGQKGELEADRFRVHALLKQQIATHLTQAQRDRLAEMKAERRAKWKERKRERHAKPAAE